MKTKPLTFILAVQFLFFYISFSMVFADDFQDGRDAYDRGDFKTAYSLWLPLAEQGDVESQFYLGVKYENGQGVPKDYKEAVKWYRLSAEQGFSLAQLSLGYMHQKGLGVPQDNKEAVKWYRLSAEQGNGVAKSELSKLKSFLEESKDGLDYLKSEFVFVHNAKESIEIHTNHFANCTGEKVEVLEHKDIIIYSVKAQLSCLLAPLSKTKPRSKSKTSWKYDRSVSEIELSALDSSSEDVLLSYDSLSDGGEAENIYPLYEGLIKLSENGQTIVFTAPESDGGVTHIKQISSKYIIVRVFGHTWQSAYLVSTDLKEMNYLTNGGVEVVNLEKLIFKSRGRKDYFKNVGGAFWYNAIIDRNGKIIDIDNEDLDSEYKLCFSKSDFLKKSYIELPKSARDIICVNR